MEKSKRDDAGVARLPDGQIDFLDGNTTLEQLAADGWKINGNGHSVWFEYRENWSGPPQGPRVRRSIPHWVSQMIRRAERDAVESVQYQIRRLLGIKSNSKLDNLNEPWEGTGVEITGTSP